MAERKTGLAAVPKAGVPAAPAEDRAARVCGPVLAGLKGLERALNEAGREVAHWPGGLPEAVNQRLAGAAESVGAAHRDVLAADAEVRASEFGRRR